MRRTAEYILLSLFLILLQTSVVNFLSIATIVPDLLIVWIVYIAIRQGQFVGTIAGFVIGLLLDLISGKDGMLGLAAMAKTVCGFTAGYFYNENKTVQTLGGYRFILAIAIASLLHNVIYFLIFLQGSEIQWWGALLWHGVPTTVYTTVFGLLPMFAFARKYLS